MGNLWVKLLQRAVPAMKEHQRTIEILTNQNIMLKRYLGLFAVTGGLFAVAGLLYIKTRPKIPDSLECIICSVNPKEVILKPCGHVCICCACAEKLCLPSGRVKCPVCRIEAETSKVFIM